MDGAVDADVRAVGAALHAQEQSHGARRTSTAWRVGFAVVVIGAVLAWFAVRAIERHTPGCVIAAVPSADPSPVRLTPEQADNAATIAGVGRRLGMPDHAVTVALATAMQDSRLRNLSGGDRHSAGLFQQRPSEGWGTHAQIVDPVHASTAFYERLQAFPGCTGLSVTQAAQDVQHSARPDAYAQWETQARAIASALTGERAQALSCHDLSLKPSSASLVSTAIAELGNARLSGAHDQVSGWAIGSWLVAHAARLGIDQVTFNGTTWTAASGSWSNSGSADGRLSLRRAAAKS
jgi:hypothetical protein